MRENTQVWEDNTGGLQQLTDLEYSGRTNQPQTSLWLGPQKWSPAAFLLPPAVFLRPLLAQQDSSEGIPPPLQLSGLQTSEYVLFPLLGKHLPFSGKLTMT